MGRRCPRREDARFIWAHAGRCFESFPIWLQGIAAAANTVSNHVNTFNQNSIADLNSGNTVAQNIAAGNGGLAAYSVGAGCQTKIAVLTQKLAGLGGDSESLTDPCYRGGDGKYYEKENP